MAGTPAPRQAHFAPLALPSLAPLRSRDAITVPSPCHRRYLPGGFAPPDPPTGALARRFAGSLRSRGWLAVLVRGMRSLHLHLVTVFTYRGASPRRTPPTGALARRFAGSLRSRGWLAVLVRGMRSLHLHLVTVF